MSKTIIGMVLNSKYRFAYFLILVLPIIIINFFIYHNTLNFTILLLINFIATFLSLILNLEMTIQEEGTRVYNYLKTLRSENYVIIYRTVSICSIIIPITILTSLIINFIYIREINPVQQFIYLVLIIFANFFYTYFIQYLAINFKNILLRNVIIISITAASMLSIMTRSMATYIMFVTVLGLFLAVTFMNRRLIDELKREEDNDI